MQESASKLRHKTASSPQAEQYLKPNRVNITATFGYANSN